MSGTVTFTYLTQMDVKACGGTDMERAIEDVEAAFRLHALGESRLPSKTVLRWGDAASEKVRGRVNAMPGFLGGRYNVSGIKWMASSPENPFRRGLPRGSGLIILNDPETGLPLAVMDATIVSAMRTGAATGVAAKHLAHPESERVALIGTGVQAHTQLQALRAVLGSLREVRVYDLRPERAHSFIKQVAETEADSSLAFRLCASPEEAVRGADVVVTVTTAGDPIIREGWLAPGALYAQCGGNEAEAGVVRECALVVCDDWGEVRHRGIHTPALMYEKGLLTDKEIGPDLGRIVLVGPPTPKSSGDRTLFCSVGNALEDLAIAKRLYDEAARKGVGARLTLWDEPHWI